MKILVLHNNFPGQFKFLLPDILSRNHDVLFLSLESHGSKIKGVKHFVVGTKDDSANHSWSVPYKGISNKLKNAEIFRAAFQKLRDSGYYPDITIFHSGWGIGYFLKSIFPKTKSFAYAEWWFNWDSAEALFDPGSKFSPSSNINEKVSQQYLNLCQASEIADADSVWSPTLWQKDQFPKSVQQRIEVIHDGVDTSVFVPSNNLFKMDHQINITYTSRALEPMRCYNHFYKIIAPVMKSFRSIQLTIVGKKQPVYRPTSSSKITLFEESFKYFEKHKLTSRINYFPRLGFEQYSKLLFNSHIHFYFSRPFVASWSLLEAMSSGCCLVSNQTPMTNEFLRHKQNGLFVDCIDNEKSVNTLSNFLSDEALINSVGKKARLTASKYDYRQQLKLLRELIGY